MRLSLFSSKQWIIKQLLDSVFVISRIIKVEVSVISLSLRLRLITLTSTLIIPDITKTSSNNHYSILNQRSELIQFDCYTCPFWAVYLNSISWTVPVRIGPIYVWNYQPEKHSLFAKATVKQSQHFNATHRNIVGSNMLRAFGHTFATCCNMLGGVGSSLETVKFEPTCGQTQETCCAQQCYDMLRLKFCDRLAGSLYFCFFQSSA